MRKIKFISFFVIVILIASSCLSKKSSTTVSKPQTSPAIVVSKPSADDDFNFRSLFYDACNEKIKGNVDVAQNLFKNCLKIKPTSAPVNYELANIYRFAGQYDNALTCAKIAALQDNKNEWYNLLYIECLHNNHLYNDAAARYETIISKSPYRADFYEGLASEYIYAGKTDKALQAYDRLQKATGPNDDIALQKVKLYKQLKRWDDAEVELKKLIESNPKETRYYTYLAELYQDEGKPEKALATYTKILKTDSANPYIHLALADYYRMERKDSLFFIELKTAFNSERLDIDSKIKILISLYSITEESDKYLPKAYDLCNSLVTQYPTDPKSHSVYADFLYRDKKIKEAIVQLQQVLQYDDSKYAVWNQLLDCELRINSNDSLEKHSAQAIELFPKLPIPYYSNGIANMRLKRYSKAAEAFKEGKQFVFEDVPLQVGFSSYLAEVYNTLKEYDKSDKAFDEALDLDPNNAGVMNNYAYYLSLRKDKLDKAEKLSKHSLELAPSSVSYMDTYGWILYQQQKYEEAKKYLEKAFDRGGYNRPAIVEHYGDVLFKLNDIAKAVEYWKKAKELGATSDQLDKKIADKKLYE